ncbi:peptidylprolyl isomerase [Kineosporia sp. R_H_3]|uniref:peptidylprolyl isomerase n=1 Tax=Kineosporia sp. R_H_3 TaxID=1961848 RepID=UPI000B4B1A19|nr:peptidylprolyl isomerase [Kineosporia sp. R_H_3]
MSPTSREKAYARKRYEKWEQKQAVKQAARRARRRNTIAAVSAIAAVGLVVGGVMYFTRDSGSTADPAASATPSASASATPSASADANNPCPEPTAKAGEAQSFDAAPSEADARGKKFTVTVETTCGPLLMELDGSKAPKAVASFVFLAKKGYFDNTPCHRLTTEGIFVLQCGDPTGTGTGGPGYSYGPVENAPKDDVYPAGTIAMARQGGNGDSMGSQFFLVYKDSTIPSDNAGGYTIMGTVTGGQDVVEKVAAGGVTGGGTDGAPARAVSITSTAVAQG